MGHSLPNIYFLWGGCGFFFCIFFPIFAGRMTSILIITPDGLTEKTIAFLGLWRHTRKYTWTDFEAWHKKVEDGIIWRVWLFTKKKKCFQISYNVGYMENLKEFRINEEIYQKTNADVDIDDWKKLTQGIISIASQNMPENFPKWYDEQLEKHGMRIVIFFAIAIIVMVLVYFSPVAVLIFGIINEIIKAYKPF
jgi:hypothetical protein